MSRTIFCTFLQREADGQDFQLYPGELGKRIYNEISKEAWAQWQHKQTMLINEKAQHDEPGAPQTRLSRRWCSSCLKGKTCTSKATRRRKTVRALRPLKNKHNTHARNDEKYLALALIAPLLVSVFQLQ